MPIPDRSELPEKFVEYIIKQNREFEEYEPEGAVLPAESTPAELIEAAQTLDRLIAFHRVDGSTAAELIEEDMRPFIDAAIAEKITEPIDENWWGTRRPRPVNWEDHTDRYEDNRKDLNAATVAFKYMLIGDDDSTPKRVEQLRNTALMVRKELARRLDIELDLTDEEWWQL